MSDSSKAAVARLSRKRLKDQIDRLTDHPSGLVDLGYALVGPGSPADEQVCDACQASLPEYIEAELNGEPVRRQFPDVARHLDLCPRCGETYVDLLELALATEAATLPILAEKPAFDLSFLPSLKPAEQLRQFTESLTEQILSRWHPEALADLPTAISAFFRKLDQLGPRFQLHPQPASVLGFGTRLPPALESVAAAHAATTAIAQALSQEKLADELSASRPSQELQKQARSAARGVGMRSRDAKRWAEVYTAEIQAQDVEFLALAQKLREEKTD